MAAVLRSARDVAALIEAHAPMRGLLAVVASLGLADGWIGAGFVRNAVWDVLHGRDFDIGSLDDVDVVHFDPADAGGARDAALEEELRRLRPGPNWQVRNQARMHRRNGDRPYRDTADAIAHWPETATAVAARLAGGRVEILAPHGLDDLLGLTVRPTPAFRGKTEIYRQRLAGKDWAVRWPRLHLSGPESGGEPATAP
ncbi:nucleotidyltransferase family protein [Microvirga thermotolerans]|uniref:nucleotidyltransferase family protein n=1 Tax=Microvirga thermotolerans TaxID=2651334 RepID=UPI001FE2BD3F|nr:nucleotidyltransferase family protein [Microvirga thermotolerans]